MKKPIVGVVFGSRSTEHDVSIVTAIAAVIKPLELTQKFDVLPIYISKQGKWYAGTQYGDIQIYRTDAIDKLLAKDKPVSLQLGGGLKLISQGLRPKTTTIDIIFPATHGTHGENGELMALCELADVPYVGCDFPSSVLAMDKVLAKQICQINQIAIAPFVSFKKSDYDLQPETWIKKIAAQLVYPMFVKPAHLGSSIGISKVDSEDQLANAIEVALHYDNKVLVEQAIQNLVEVTLPIVGNNSLTPALLEQPSLKGDDFFDFDSKYMQGGKKGKGQKSSDSSKGSQGYSSIPANIPRNLYDKAIQVGLKVYGVLGCTGIARVDMLIDTKAEVVYFNEVNPLPGSLYAHNWAKSGISNVMLVSRLIDLALERHEKQKAVETSFTTSYLKQF